MIWQEVPILFWRRLPMFDLQSPEFIARFEANYTPEPNSGCWLWTGSLSNSYGTLSFQGKSLRAHRVSYQMAKGHLSGESVVMHLCDNKVCVNPDHLIAGTIGDNVRDYHAKLRTDAAHFLKRAGVAPVAAGSLRKYTDEEVLAVRASSASNRDIASILGGTHTVIGLIKRGLAYGVVNSAAVADPALVQRLNQLPSSASEPRGWHTERRERARQMRSSGASYAEIARALGVVRSRAFELSRPVPTDPLAICH